MRGCSYVDRQQRACQTSWCIDHVKVVVGMAYCPRHAGVMKAILRSSSPGERPPVMSRAPSLTAWMVESFDGEVTKLLTRASEDDLEGSGGTGGVVRITQTALAHAGTGRDHRWEQAWELHTEQLQPLRVAVVVKEDVDIVVSLQVGDRIVTRIVPPWIEQHQLRAEISNEPELHAQFVQRILVVISQALEIDRRKAITLAGRSAIEAVLPQRPKRAAC